MTKKETKIFKFFMTHDPVWTLEEVADHFKMNVADVSRIVSSGIRSLSKERLERERNDVHYGIEETVSKEKFNIENEIPEEKYHIEYEIKDCEIIDYKKIFKTRDE